ncbi:hypothetical protein LTR95_005182 [Oleoguttula sp. CCFEE 5521]
MFKLNTPSAGPDTIMGVTYSQFFPPAPTLTEVNVPRQDRRVFIVSGGASGVGLELCRFLYHAGGKVYIAGRSAQNAQVAITRIKAEKLDVPQDGAPGELAFLQVALDDLSTVKSAAERFTAAETRLDVLFNNAGVSNPPKGSLSPQGHELTMATNCLGPYLLTQLLLPMLQQTARAASPGSVRVVWTASVAVEFAQTPDGTFANPALVPQRDYEKSKVGNWFLAAALAKQSLDILSVVQNPGNLKTQIVRHFSSIVPLMAAPLLYHAKYGAYTELWAGLSDDLTLENNGSYVVPWGRLHPAPRADMAGPVKELLENDSGVAADFRDFCDAATVKYR